MLRRAPLSSCVAGAGCLAAAGLVALAAPAPSPAASAAAGSIQEAVYGFGCVQHEGSYLVALGLIPRPSFDVVLNPMAVPPWSDRG